MAAVAERLVFGMFAGAPGHGFLFENLDLLPREAGALVRTVAKRLALRAATGAPPIGARLHELNNGKFLGWDWVRHRSLYFFLNSSAALVTSRSVRSKPTPGARFSAALI